MTFWVTARHKVCEYIVHIRSVCISNLSTYSKNKNNNWNIYIYTYHKYKKTIIVTIVITIVFTCVKQINIYIYSIYQQNVYYTILHKNALNIHMINILIFHTYIYIYIYIYTHIINMIFEYVSNNICAIYTLQKMFTCMIRKFYMSVSVCLKTYIYI